MKCGDDATNNIPNVHFSVDYKGNEMNFVWNAACGVNCKYSNISINSNTDGSFSVADLNSYLSL